ncbi:hypothetical protein CMO93_02345 [Candidatus Woesearchaeota archaeon]|jgi:hypothetical protein|nr:hypothetical protein [Candidatus Woesearchaeota archaeon]|tara:strand:- start:399 stop:1241 length:843 start_codon:yes stop_codon:yes gene_type:complete
MDNIVGIEDFLNEFIGWYNPFLAGIRNFNLDDRSSDANTNREKVPWKEFLDLSRGETGTFAIYKMGCPDAPKWDPDEMEWGQFEKILEGFTGTYIKGTLPALNEKEQELSDRIAELSNEHDVEVTPVFLYLQKHTSSPQYDLFVHSLVFGKDKDRKIAATIGWASNQSFYSCNDNIRFMFDKHPILNGDEKSDGTTFGDSLQDEIIHPNGEDFARILYWQNETSLNKGIFYFDGKKVFEFSARRKAPWTNTPAKLESQILLPQQYLGSGAITAFLEMVGE